MDEKKPEDIQEPTRPNPTEETALTEEDRAWLNTTANPKEPEKKTEEIPPQEKATRRAAKKTTRKTTKKRAKKTLPRSPPRKKTAPKGMNRKTLFMIVLIALLLLVIGSLTTTILRSRHATRLPEETKVITLITSNCEPCSIPQDIAQRILSANITIFQETDIETKEGKELAETYGITTLPAIIILNSNAFPDFEQRQDAAIYQAKDAPYYDTTTETITGGVKATILNDPACTDCPDLLPLVTQLKEAGIAITTTEEIDATTTEGKNLISSYTIDKIPTLILDREAEAYALIATNWDVLGTREEDGSYIIRNVTPPYIDLQSGELKGLIAVTYLVDSSCEECYDVKLHREVLIDKLKMKARTESTTDINSQEGEQLIADYNITKVPTVLVSKEAEEYPFFTQIWALLGTIEPDGTAIFRNFDALSGQTYKDLETDSIIRPTPPNTLPS